jgi:hypothetical protein
VTGAQTYATIGLDNLGGNNGPVIRYGVGLRQTAHCHQSLSSGISFSRFGSKPWMNIKMELFAAAQSIKNNDMVYHSPSRMRRVLCI